MNIKIEEFFCNGRLRSRMFEKGLVTESMDS
jgi:hypothetical protein